jgi:hypothetical protein
MQGPNPVFTSPYNAASFDDTLYSPSRFFSDGLLHFVKKTGISAEVSGSYELPSITTRVICSDGSNLYIVVSSDSVLT